MNQTEEKLMSLKWRPFSEYPKEGSRIIVHLSGFDTIKRQEVHKFLLTTFVFKNFDHYMLSKRFPEYHTKWNYSWRYKNE